VNTFREQLDACRRCKLWRNATQAVAGAGNSKDGIMLVGEQPGDREDLEGRPFVGPAGRVLDECLAAAGLERNDVYVTNAVKHFKWERRGKRRLHKRPSASEIDACQPWLAREIDFERPRVIVALGATAARALLIHQISVAASRGHKLAHPSGSEIVVTYHPSAVLRAAAASLEIRAALVEDLRRALLALPGSRA
jgi:uracil-DNA glycosylase